MKEVYIEIGKLLHSIQKSGQFVEITCNMFYSDERWRVTGYCGYDGSRMSDIDRTEDGEKLISLLNSIKKGQEIC